MKAGFLPVPCSFQQPPMSLFLLQTPCLLILLLLTCFSLSSGGFSDDRAQFLSNKNQSLATSRRSHLTNSECSPKECKQRTFLSLFSHTVSLLFWGVFAGLVLFWLIEYIVHIDQIQNKPNKQFNHELDGSYFQKIIHTLVH